MREYNFLFCVVVFVLCVTAQDNRPTDENNYFIYPPLPGLQFSDDPSVFEDNILLTAGVKQNEPFKWVSDLTSLALYLQQEGNTEDVKNESLIRSFLLFPTPTISDSDTNIWPTIPDCNQAGDGWIYWDGDLGSIDLKISKVAFLAVWDCSNGVPVGIPVFFSHYFNLTAATKSSASTSAATRTTKTTSPSMDTLTTASSPTATSGPSSAVGTASPTATHDPQSSTNTAALAGGIGGGIGGAIILVAVAVAFWRLGMRRTQDKQEDRPQLPPTIPTAQSTDLYFSGASVPSYPSPPPKHAETSPQTAALKLSSSNTPVEMSSHPTPVELPSDSVPPSTERSQMD